MIYSEYLVYYAVIGTGTARPADYGSALEPTRGAVEPGDAQDPARVEQ